MGKKLSEEVVFDSDTPSDDVSDSAREKSGVDEDSVKTDGSSSEAESEGSDSSSDSSEKISDEKYRSSLTPSFPSQAFKPPSGFKSTKSHPPPSSSVSSLLSNLHGKQIFHIAAPEYLPLSTVREVSLAKVISGEPILTHQGVSYGIPVDAQEESAARTLLVYNKDNDTYQSAPVKNIPSYRVQELVRLPGGIDPGRGGSLVSPTAETSNPPRPQPNHLRMHFRPVGSGNGPPETIGTSSESEGEQPTFKFPQRLKSEQDERKKRKTEERGKQKNAKESSRKRLKKQDNDPLPSSSQATSQGTQGERGRKDSSQKHKKPHKHKDETSQERRARREEKKRKKAEKAA